MHVFSGHPAKPRYSLSASTQHSLLFRVFNELKTLISITHTNLKKETHMKKYVITLAAMALAIGGSINFAGCGGEPDVDPDAVKGGDATPTGDGMTEEEKAEAKKHGFDIGNKDTPEAPKK